MQTDNFSSDELSCRHCGQLPLPTPDILNALDCIQQLRTEWGKPMVLNCAHRCTAHNADVGGAENSRHLWMAFDVSTNNFESEDAVFEFIALAIKNKFTGIGIYKTFIHLDTGFELKHNRCWDASGGARTEIFEKTKHLLGL